MDFDLSLTEQEAVFEAQREAEAKARADERGEDDDDDDDDEEEEEEDEDDEEDDRKGEKLEFELSSQDPLESQQSRPSQPREPSQPSSQPSEPSQPLKGRKGNKLSRTPSMDPSAKEPSRSGENFRRPLVSCADTSPFLQEPTLGESGIEPFYPSLYGPSSLQVAGPTTPQLVPDAQNPSQDAQVSAGDGGGVDDEDWDDGAFRSCPGSPRVRSRRRPLHANGHEVRQHLVSPSGYGWTCGCGAS